MLFFNSYRSPTIAGDTTPNPLLPFSSSLFLPLSLRHPNLHQQWQTLQNEESKEEFGIFDPSCPEACAAILWKSSQAAPKAAEKLKITAQEHYRLRIADGIIPEVGPSMENEEALGTDGIDGFLSNLANAIPGIDEAMSFAEMLKFNFLKKEMLMLSFVMSMTLMSSGFESV
ncbi:uncharacterized protein LOC114303194 isoform X2 [Camellia sinensis]|uniref:uncharacterized protein LOC114303194 isoform X2 n=1 Tax=Camellia sinensis TaxID=4442 RepID=UPI001035E3B2|nr:uncharacterized protein LOC114303194 isoform X2 [Camellia sinensis]